MHHSFCFDVDKEQVSMVLVKNIVDYRKIIQSHREESSSTSLYER